MVRVIGLLHASLLVSDLARARRFYEELLGLTPSPARPEMSYAGVWYDVGGAQIHLICLPSPDPATGRPEHGGRDRHTALAVSDWETLRQSLLATGMPHTLSRSGRRALFLRDPDGNALELVDNQD